MNPTSIRSLAPIIKANYFPDGKLKSFLTLYGDHYTYYGPSYPWGHHFSINLIDEVTELLKAPTESANLDELKEF
jgi:hypothetical protein